MEDDSSNIPNFVKIKPTETLNECKEKIAQLVGENINLKAQVMLLSKQNEDETNINNGKSRSTALANTNGANNLIDENKRLMVKLKEESQENKRMKQKLQSLEGLARELHGAERIRDKYEAIQMQNTCLEKENAELHSRLQIVTQEKENLNSCVEVSKNESNESNQRLSKLEKEKAEYYELVKTKYLEEVSKFNIERDKYSSKIQFLSEQVNQLTLQCEKEAQARQDYEKSISILEGERVFYKKRLEEVNLASQRRQSGNDFETLYIREKDVSAKLQLHVDAIENEYKQRIDQATSMHAKLESSISELNFENTRIREELSKAVQRRDSDIAGARSVYDNQLSQYKSELSLQSNKIVEYEAYVRDNASNGIKINAWLDAVFCRLRSIMACVDLIGENHKKTLGMNRESSRNMMFDIGSKDIITKLGLRLDADINEIVQTAWSRVGAYRTKYDVCENELGELKLMFDSKIRSIKETRQVEFGFLEKNIKVGMSELKVLLENFDIAAGKIKYLKGLLKRNRIAYNMNDAKSAALEPIKMLKDKSNEVNQDVTSTDCAKYML